MGFFDDDPFEGIMREFFGGSPVRSSRQFIRGEEEDRNLDFVEDEKKVYLVFELPGFREEDVSIEVNGRDLEISAQKKNGESMQDYLNQKLRRGVVIKKKLPSMVDSKNFSHTMKNGVFEVVFNKKGGTKK